MEKVVFTKEAEYPRNQHYLTSIQPIKVMEANLTREEFIGFLKGNIIKYVLRCGKKDAPIKEIEKLMDYAEWLKEVYEEKEIIVEK